MLLKINTAKSHIRLTDRAQHDLRALGVGQSTRKRRRDVVAACPSMKPLQGVGEEHWLAEGVIAGKPVVLLLVRHPGAPWGPRSETVSVRGAWSPEAAAELQAEGRGLLPFHQAVKQGINATIENN